MLGALRVQPKDAPFLSVLLAGWAIAVHHASMGMYHLAIIAAGMAALGAWVFGFERVPAVTRRSLSGLDGLKRACVPVAAASARVLAIEGECVWGYRTGDRWEFGIDASVTPRLCQTALTAITSRIRLPEGNWGGAARVVCRCPLAGRRAFFGVSWGGE